jgi:hypothetical protein
VRVEIVITPHGELSYVRGTGRGKLGSPADEDAQTVLALQAWSWNGPPSAQIALDRLRATAGFRNVVLPPGRPDLVESKIDDWPGSVLELVVVVTRD